MKVMVSHDAPNGGCQSCRLLRGVIGWLLFGLLMVAVPGLPAESAGMLLGALGS